MEERAAVTDRTAAGIREPEALKETPQAEGAEAGLEPPIEEKKPAEEAKTGECAGTQKPEPFTEGAEQPGTADIEKVPDADDETLYIDPAEDALNASETIRDMALGLALAAAVLAAAGCIFVREERYRWVFGVLLGAAAAGLMLRHLYVTIDRALDMDEEHASKYMKKSATLRILMAGVALAAGALLPELFHVFGVLAGVLCLKFSAYLQPLTHKAIKFFSKGG